MSLTAGNVATSSDILAFKNALINEAKRRQYGQDPYGGGALGTSWQANFTDSASAGQPIKTSHYRQTVGWINDNFTNYGTSIGWASTKNSGDKLNSIYDIYNFLVNGLAKASMQANTQANTCCPSVCTGLCFGSCRADCQTGCTAARGGCSNHLGGGYCANQ